ncbi:MAG TPA: adenylate/guanylate cyclase domain-containing protein, partial [Polyangiaceae bacterium]
MSGPERRQVTVLFSDLVGSTQLSRVMDPEDWHQLVNRLHSRCGEVIAEHRGHVAQYLGDGLLAYFGYPLAAQDDAQRAVRAGLEMVHEARRIAGEAGQSIRMRVGIHTGPVVIGNIGSSRHQESLAFGETLNLAARIQEFARANTVIVSPQTHRLIDPFFRCREMGSFTPKGFADKVALFEVQDESGLTTRMEAASAAGLAPLVGRDDEMAALADAWKAALSGGAPIRLLIGEAGIGKSRLIHALEERVAADATVIELRCSEHARTSAFHPVIDCLQRYAGLRHGEPPAQVITRLSHVLAPSGLQEEQIALIASLFGVTLPASMSAPSQGLRPAILNALSTWIGASERKAPTLFVVEDLQWADPSTLDLLASVIAQPKKPMLALLSARPEFAPPWAASERLQTIAPRRLESRDSKRLMAFIAKGKHLPNDLVDRLGARAEGIPLFVEEMTKSVLESGIVRETPAGYELEKPVSGSSIPATIQDSLMSRLDQLGHCKPVAQVAALLGREFSLPLLQNVWQRLSMPRIDLEAGLARIAEAQLIVRNLEGPEITYQFRHSLLQDAAYESLLRSSRRTYHQRAAEALVADFSAHAELQPELVARHYSAAQDRERAVEFWSKAGQRSLGGSAYVEAASHFNAAIEQLTDTAATLDRSRRELDLRTSLGVALITTRGFAAREVEASYGRAAELCNELGTELPLRVLYGVWVVNFVGSNLSSSRLLVSTLEQLTQAARDSASSLVAYAALVSWAFWQGQYDKVAEYHAA